MLARKVFLFVGCMLMLFSARIASAAWLTGWDNRIAVTITGQTGASTNYPCSLYVGETAGATGEHFHLNGLSADFPAVKGDGGDLRFTDNDEVTTLDFWVETVTGTTPNRLAKIWVEVKDDLESNVVIYCYFKKSGATNDSHGDSTFLFFDDFAGSSLDAAKWDEINTPTIAVGGDTIKVTSSSAAFKSITSDNSWDRNVCTMMRARTVLAYTFCGLGVDGTPNDEGCWFYWSATTRQIRNGNEASITYQTITASDDVWYNLNITWKTNECKFYMDGTLKGTNTANVSDEACKAALGAYNKTITADWFAVRKWQTTEPAFASATAIASNDTLAPTPNPATWDSIPYNIGTADICMKSSEATDAGGSGENYQFQFVSSPTGGTGGDSSAWQDGDMTYTDAELDPNEQYIYTVQYKDDVENVGTASAPGTTYTSIETPTGVRSITVQDDSIQVASINTPSNLANGSSGLQFICTSTSDTSEWVQVNSYTFGGLAPDTYYSFKIQARNGDGDTSEWCPIDSIKTLVAIPGVLNISDPTDSTLSVTVDATTQNGNHASIEYAIFNTTTSEWMDTTGTGVSGTLFVHDMLYLNTVTKDGDNPVITKGAIGAWNGLGIRDPMIVVDSLGYRYMAGDTMFMMFNGMDTSATNMRIGLAYSTDDGDTWTKFADYILEESYRHYCGGGCCIRRTNDFIIYFLYKEAVSAAYSINYATSTSLYSGWTINTDNPSPPVVDTSYCASSGFGEVITVALPNVTSINDTLWMMTEGNHDGLNFHIFMMWSVDWVTWYAVNAGTTIYNPPNLDPDDYGQANPSLYEIDDGKYMIFYNGEPAANLWEEYCIYSTSLRSGWTRWNDSPFCPRGAGGQWDDGRLEGFRITMDEIAKDTWQGWYFGTPSTASIDSAAIGRATLSDTIRTWLTATDWGTETFTGLTTDTEYCFEVTARNADEVGTYFGTVACETASSPVEAVMMFLRSIGVGIGIGIH